MPYSQEESSVAAEEDEENGPWRLRGPNDYENAGVDTVDNTENTHRPRYDPREQTMEK